MNEHNKRVTANIIIGAETGGQRYGEGRWDDVKLPKIGKEVTLTLGAYQFYGNEGRDLLKMIYPLSGTYFVRSILDSLDRDWVAEKYVPDVHTRHLIGNIIASETGRKQQVELFCNIQMPNYIKRAESFGVFDDRAQIMWVEIEHVGGLKAAERVFKRCNGDYSLDKIMWSLKQDQYDHSSENQAGDSLYWSRHEFCRKCIDRYATVDNFDGVYVIVE